MGVKYKNYVIMKQGLNTHFKRNWRMLWYQKQEKCYIVDGFTTICQT